MSTAEAMSVRPLSEAMIPPTGPNLDPFTRSVCFTGRIKALTNEQTRFHQPRPQGCDRGELGRYRARATGRELLDCAPECSARRLLCRIDPNCDRDFHL